jgi:transglutaminase-like putative cysteine protease
VNPDTSSIADPPIASEAAGHAAGQAASQGAGQPESLYFWEGARPLANAVVHRKRYALAPGREHCYCPFDLRRWVTPPEDELLAIAWRQIAAVYSTHLSLSGPQAAAPAELAQDPHDDAKAMIVWHYVVEHIRYTRENHGYDFWQFPPETLQLRSGDCEDKAFLCASLLLAAGIPTDRVRVAIGVLARSGPLPGSTLEKQAAQPHPSCGSEGHAWAMYRTTSGVWCILEPNYPHLPTSRGPGSLEWFIPERPVDVSQAVLLPADMLASDGAAEQYVPLVCFHHQAVWSVEERRPGRVRGAARFTPDWSRQPEFDQILQMPAKAAANG